MLHKKTAPDEAEVADTEFTFCTFCRFTEEMIDDSRESSRSDRRGHQMTL